MGIRTAALTFAIWAFFVIELVVYGPEYKIEVKYMWFFWLLFGIFTLQMIGFWTDITTGEQE